MSQNSPFRAREAPPTYKVKGPIENFCSYVSMHEHITQLDVWRKAWNELNTKYDALTRAFEAASLPWENAFNKLNTKYMVLQGQLNDLGRIDEAYGELQTKCSEWEEEYNDLKKKYEALKAENAHVGRVRDQYGDDLQYLAARYSAQSIENADQAAGIEALQAQALGLERQNETLRESVDWLKLRRDALSTENEALRTKRGNGVLVPGPELEALRAELAFYKGLCT